MRKILTICAFLFSLKSFGRFVTPDQIDSVLKKSLKGKTKIINPKEPKAFFCVYKKKDHQPITVFIRFYDIGKQYQFYYIDSQLVKVKFLEYTEKKTPRYNHTAVYYFTNDSLLQKKEINLPPQDINEIHQLGIDYFLKAKTIFPNN